MAIGTRLTAVSEYLFRRLFKVLFRYDIFISYARRDGKGYALKLKEQLMRLDFSCFLDYDELPAGNSLNKTLRRAIKKSATVIVVGTEGALKSRYVELEVGEFARTGRAIIPIDFEGTLAEAPWQVIKERDLVWVDETKDALAKATPSPPVADAIDKLFKYTRRNVRVRGQVIATAALFLLGAAISVVVIRQQVTAANLQRHEAEVARGRAEDATRTAKEQEELAKKSALRAKEKEQEATEKTEEARKQGEIAEKQTAEAQKQATIARAKAEEARQQQRIAEQQQKLASSRELSANAMSQLQIDPELSLVLAGKSAEVARTFEAEDALRRSLLESHLRTAAEGHSGAVTAASFTPDGEFAVVTGNDNAARVLRLSDGQTIAELRGHTKPLRGAAFSPDGKLVVTAGEDKIARVWDWRANRVMVELPHPEAVSSARFSHDGAAIITTSDDNAARVWDAKTGRRISPILYGILAKEYRGIKTVNIQPFSPDGRYVFFVPATDAEDRSAHEKRDESGSERRSEVVYEDGQASVWDVSAGRVVSQLDKKLPHVLTANINAERNLMVTYRGHPKRNGPTKLWDLSSGLNFAVLREPKDALINSVALSPDGRFVVTANADGTTRVWEVPENRKIEEKISDTERSADEGDGQLLNKPLWVLGGHRGPVRSVVFSPDGRFILTTSDDGTALVWDVKTGREVSVLRGHGLGLLSGAFSRDGRRMITWGNDRIARVWDAGMGQGFRELGQGEVESALFGARSNVVMTTHSKYGAQVWDSVTTKSLPLTWPGREPAISPDGTKIVVANKELPRIYDAATGRVLKELPASEVTVYSPDGRFVATGENGNVVRVRDANTGELVKEMPTPTGALAPLLFSPRDSNFLMIGGSVWEWKTDRPPVKLIDFEGASGSGAFSPDGRLIALPWLTTVALWDSRTGCRFLVQWEHRSQVSSAAFGLDGRSLLSVDPYAAKLWQLPLALTCETKEELRESVELDHTKTGSFAKTNALLSPDSTFIVLTGNTQVQVHDARTGQLKFKLGDDSTSTYGAGVSSNGKLIVTVSPDGNTRVWDSDSGKLVRTLEGSTTVPLRAALFSPDDSLIVVVSDQRFTLVTVWDAVTGKQVGEPLRGQWASFTPDGRSILTVSGGDFARVSAVSDGRLIAELQGMSGTVIHLAFSDDGLRIMAETSDRKVGVWDAASGRNLARHRYEGDIKTVAFSKDGKLIATTTTTAEANWKTVAQVWDSETDRLSKLEEDTVGSIAFSPNGEFVITSYGTVSGSEGTKLWNARTGEKDREVIGHFAAFSADGKRMATVSSNTARVWDAMGVGIPTELRSQTGNINSAEFSPDGKFLLTTADRDSIAVLWNAETGAVETELFGETSYGIKSAAFSPDGKSILLLGEDKRARLYACVMCGGWDELRDRARERFALHPRKLSLEEQKKFVRQTSASVTGGRPSDERVP